MYFILKETFVDDEIYIKDDDLNEKEREDSIRGQTFAKPSLPYEFYYTKKTLKDFVTSQITPIVSDKFKNVLEQIGANNVIFYPATLKRSRTSKNGHGNYFLMILEPLSFLDYQKSIYTGIEAESFVVAVQKLVIDTTKTTDKAIFRFKEIVGEIVINKSLKTALEAANITGLEYIPSEKFQFP